MQGLFQIVGYSATNFCKLGENGKDSGLCLAHQ
jgi:hypothetical protein